MPGVRRPAECPACAVEAKRRKLAGDGPPSDVSEDDEVVMDEAQEQGTGEACAASGTCEHICKRCMECQRVLATTHLLDLHIREAHDAMFTILAKKQPMYECFEESCKEKYTTGEERLMHAVKEHGYPKKFRITKKEHRPKEAKKDQKTDKSATKDESTSQMEVVEQNERLKDADSDEKPAVAKGKFVYSYKVPSNVCFGKGTQKGFHRPKHWHQQHKPKQETKKDSEKDIDMTDLVDTWKLDT